MNRTPICNIKDSNNPSLTDFNLKYQIMIIVLNLLIFFLF